MKENNTGQELTAQKVAKMAKERPRPRARKEARWYWTLKNVVNWIESGLEKGDETIRTMLWHRQVRASAKNRDARKNWLRRLQNFARRDNYVQLCKESHMISLGDQQEKSNVFCVYRGITGRLTQQEKVVNSLVYRKICPVQSWQLLLEVLPIGFTLKWTVKLW